MASKTKSPNQTRSPEEPDDIDEITPQVNPAKPEAPSGKETEVDIPNNAPEMSLDIEVEQEPAAKDYFFHPSIVCGYCEACGTAKYVGGKVTKSIDKQSGGIKHRLSGGHWQEITACTCPHYAGLYAKGQRIKCQYCNEEFTGIKTSSGQFKEILGTRQVYVMSFAREPKKLIMYCDAFECREKHLKRLKSD